MEHNLNSLISISSLVVAAVSLYVAWVAFNRDKADLQVRLQLSDKTGQYGIAYDGKDHIIVTALNVGRRPIVLKDVELVGKTSAKHWFRTPKYKHHHFADQFGGFSGGGSFGEPQKIEPGYEFKMMLELSTKILVGHYKLANVYVPDTLVNIFQPGKLQMYLIRRKIRKQCPEWREKLQFEKDNADHSKNGNIPEDHESNT